VPQCGTDLLSQSPSQHPYTQTKPAIDAWQTTEVCGTMWNTHSQSVEHALTDKPQSVQHTVNRSGATVHASRTTAHNLTTIGIDQPKSVQHTGRQSVHPCNRTASKSGYPDAHGTDPGDVCSLPLQSVHASRLASHHMANQRVAHQGKKSCQNTF
jgi:hypothetical protein